MSENLDSSLVRAAGSNLVAAAEKFKAERRHYEAVKESTYKLIRIGYEQGVSEVVLGRIFDLDRGTIRKILGKPRK